MLHTLALIIAAPTFVWGYSYVFGALLIGIARDFEIRGRAMPSAVWTEAWGDRWKYSTTVCRGIILHPWSEYDARTWEHEKVHVRQAEDLCFLGLVLGLLFGALWGDWAQGGLIWLLSPFGLGLNYVMAGLRAGSLATYRGAEHERAAYDHTDHLGD